MTTTPFGIFDPSMIQTAEATLLDPITRASPELVAALLHDDFTEIGRSGRRFTKQGVLDAFAVDAGEPVTCDEWSVDPLGPGLVVVTYRARDAKGYSRHTSVWDTTGELPQLRLHQGTRVAER